MRVNVPLPFCSFRRKELRRDDPDPARQRHDNVGLRLGQTIQDPESSAPDTPSLFQQESSFLLHTELGLEICPVGDLIQLT